MKVQFLENIPSPYRVAFFTEEEVEAVTYDGNQPAVTYTIYGWDDTTKALTETTKTITDYTVVTSNLIRETEDGAGLMSGHKS